MTSLSTLEIEELTPGQREAWDAFVLAHPDGTFFHRWAWCKVLAAAFGHRTHYLIAHRGGAIQGVLPLAEIRSFLFGHSLVSTPFCVYGGILAADAAAKTALEVRACALARELRVDYLEMRNRRRLHPDWPCKNLYVTFRKPISQVEQENRLAIPNRQRAMIRKGEKNGLRAEIDTRTDRHYAAYSESLRNLGTPVFARRYVQALKEAFGADCEILTVTHEGNIVSSVLSFYFRDEVLPYYGGGGMAARKLAANDFMYWQVMDRARQKGIRMFDYGRSKRDSGSYNFKKYWGFQPEPLFYEYHLVRAREVPDLSPLNPRFDWQIRIWRRLPVALTRLLGPPIARFLG